MSGRFWHFPQEKNDSGDVDWTNNGAGIPVNHKYGFGVLDVSAVVELATTWPGLGPPVRYTTDEIVVNSEIPEGETGLEHEFLVCDTGIQAIEYVQLYFSATHANYADLEIKLISPSGTESVLSVPRNCTSTCDTVSKWPFGSARMLGESPHGNWKLVVRDLINGNIGQLDSWSLKIHGIEIADGIPFRSAKKNW